MSFSYTFYIIKNKRFDIPYSHKKDISYNGSECNECSICLEKMIYDVVEIDNCKHTFHEKCIRESLKINRLCPLCRKNVDETNCGCVCF
jgi:hypothetical protein